MAWILMENAGALPPDGGVMAVTIDKIPVALYRFGEDYLATGNVCTHQYALLSDGFVEDGCVECPLHQAVFDLRTGKALSGPVSKDLETYAVKVEDGQVFVDVTRPAEISEAPAANRIAMAEERDQRCFAIVGGGQAAASAARALRDAGFTGTVKLFAREQALPYERPPLSKAILLGEAPLHGPTLLDGPAAEQLDIELHLGVTVTAIDAERKTLTAGDGETHAYDQLLLATGATPRPLPIPGADLSAVHSLRTLEDAIAFKRALQPGRHIAIIGSGFIGLEVASAARQRGCEVTLVEAAPRICSRALHPMAALRVHKLAERNGVRILTDVQTTAFEAADGGVALKLNNGDTLRADSVLVGIGVIPETALAESLDLEIDNGIVVDRFGRTGLEGVFAAGDAAVTRRDDGTLLRLESWQNAQEQAAAAARTMAGQDTAHDAVPWFWSDQFAHNIQMLGLPTADDRMIAKPGSNGAETLYFHNGERLTGVIAFNDPGAIRRGREWLRRGLSVDALNRLLENTAGAAGDARLPAPLRRGTMSDLSNYYVWPREGLTRVPDWVYTDPYIFELEVERIFHGPTWNYVALEVEIPNAGDFKQSNVGPTPVVVSRDEDGDINVFVNRCSHRAAQFCRDLRGNTEEFVCPYHQWSYDLKGNLAGVPFRRGVDGKGGMPKDFKTCDHGPTKLKVTTRHGVVFASFDHDMKPLEDYLGPDMLREFDATFDGRELKLLGYYRNSLPGNWKLYHENLKDPYHATLLHTFLVSFGLLVAGNKSQMICDETGLHGAMASAKSDGTNVSEENRKEMRAYRPEFQLEREDMLNFIPEFDSEWSVTMLTVWPNLIVQREMNTLGVRQIVPSGPDEFVMNWTMFGFADDDEEMTRHRLRQGNLMGPAGFLGLEDNEAIKFVQDGMKRTQPGEHLVALDPDTPAGTSDTLISEAAIRAMYQSWRQALDIE